MLSIKIVVSTLCPFVSQGTSDTVEDIFDDSTLVWHDDLDRGSSRHSTAYRISITKVRSAHFEKPLFEEYEQSRQNKLWVLTRSKILLASKMPLIPRPLVSLFIIAVGGIFKNTGSDCLILFLFLCIYLLETELAVL